MTRDPHTAPDRGPADDAAENAADNAAESAHAPTTEARDFARAFRSFLDWVHVSEHEERGSNEVVAAVRAHLDGDALTRSVVGRRLAPFEHVNLQTALNAWSEQPGREVVVQGITAPPHYEELHLQQMLSGDHLPPLRLSAPEFTDLPNGPGTTLACLQLAALLVTDARGRWVLLVRASAEHGDPSLVVEIAGLPVLDAQAVHAELDELRARLNVYRGHVLDVVPGHGGVQLTFADVPRTERADIVLPEEVLSRIERHALAVAEHRDALRASGQHVKRGLLLFGPPGTGKTHTTRYLVGRMADYTRLQVTGHALHAIGAVATLARALEPAVLVLEDVDLVAEDRSFGPGSNSVLFDLLDAMDGAAPDADLLFLLTTNRADLLEPALAARPGRVDVAVHIDLPDAEGRRALLTLYGRDVPLRVTDDELDEAVARTEGTTASFIKELLRRAVLESLVESSPLTVVHGHHLRRALDDLLDSTQEVTRSLLGVGNDPEQVMGGMGSGPGEHPQFGWFAGPGRFRRHVSYGDTEFGIEFD